MLSNMASVSQVMLERGVSGVNSVPSASEMTVVSEINILSDGTDVTGAISLPADILTSGECSGSVLAVCRWCLCGGSLSQLLPNFCNLVRATFGIQLGNDEDIDQYLICGSCVDKLNDSYAFRCQIEDGHNKFKSLFIKSDVDFLNVPDLMMEDSKVNILKCEYPSDDDDDDDDDDITASFDSASDLIIDTSNKTPKNKKIIIRSRSGRVSKKNNLEMKNVIKRKIAAPEPAKDEEVTPENAYNVAAHNLLNADTDASKERRRNNIKMMSETDFKKYRRLYYRIRYAKAMPFKLDKTSSTCEVCNEIFTTHKNLVSHMAMHYPNHICDLCGKAFVVKEQLAGHMRTHSTEKLSCKICGKVLKKSSMTRHLRTHSGNNGVYACPKCPERFVSFSTRINHMAEKHNVDIYKYTCSICSKKFHLANSLTKHVRRCHFQELNVSCAECGKGFFDKKSLKNHMLKHTGEKKFQCEVCRKSYGRKCTIIEHMKIHNNIKQHQCPVCDKAFTQKCTLKGHLKVHERPQKIEIAGET